MFEHIEKITIALGLLLCLILGFLFSLQKKLISIKQLTNLLVIIKSEEDFPGDMKTGETIHCEKAERNTVLG